MSDRDDFLAWVGTSLYEAELALHNGNAAPRRGLWSRNEPVSVLGAWRNANGQRELEKLFAALGKSFSDCTSFVRTTGVRHCGRHGLYGRPRAHLRLR